MTPHYQRAPLKLKAAHRADVPDDLLREFAGETLGAVRCSAGYLEALRFVLGNQARADRTGDLLEMNTTAPFTTERTMRTLLAQFEGAGITFRESKRAGPGKRLQLVSFYRGDWVHRLPPADELEQIHRDQEARDDRHRGEPPRSWDGRAEAERVSLALERFAARGILRGDVPH